MILQSLYAYAQRKKLLDDPDFEERRVDYVIKIDREGTFRALVSHQNEKGKARARKGLPRKPRRTVGVDAGFLVDNSQYALGLSKATARDPGRAAACLAMFLELVRAAAAATEDAGSRAVEAFLLRLDEQRAAVLAAAPGRLWTGDEEMAFGLVEESELVHERTAMRAHFQRGRADTGSEGPAVLCLVSGKLRPAALTHPVVKGVPDAQSSGAALVAFNADSFRSHHAEQGENAPISRQAAEGYTVGLNHLLARDGDRRFRSGVAVDGGVLVFWTHDESRVTQAVLDLFAPSFTDSAEAAVQAASAAFRGLAPEATDMTPFYATVLAGNAARVVVREWIVTTARDVKASMLSWFGDLALDGAPERMSLSRLSRALEITPGARDKRGIPAALSARMLRAVLLGGPLPRELLSAALRRIRLPPSDRSDQDIALRVALVKATLLRLHRHEPPEITVSLDPTNTQVPYLLGRLFAVLERVQAVAQGDLNATIRDRYFGAASASPTLVFPRLLKLSMHHESKLKGEKPGLAIYFDRQKAEIIDVLPAGAFPSSLDLEGQGLFAIGYYHQKQHRKAVAPEATPEEEERS
jgi:CRISPR-associated protein Csd1